MGDFWDDISKQYGYESPKPDYSLPQNAVSASNLTPSLSDPRTAAWMRNGLESARKRLLKATTTGEGRNNVLNAEAANLHSGLVQNNFMGEQQLHDWLYQAAVESGLHVDPNCGPVGIEKTIASGFAGGRKYGPRPAHRIPRTEVHVTEVSSLPGAPATNGQTDTDWAQTMIGRQFRAVDPMEVQDKLPVWAWNYGGKGRIMLGTLALFAGRPGTGKSTAARWVAGLISRGELEGYWHGAPQIVMYIAPAEESLEYIVKPGLRATNADLRYIRFHEVLDETGKPTRLMSALDEEAIAQELLGIGCRVVIVDPVMATIGSAVDIYRNNETRAFVEPWARLADRINGVVIGVVHLKKATGGDVVAAITGSSAFGEVARSVFGFVKDTTSDDGDRIMSQHKNSAGVEDMAIAYRIQPTDVTLDNGQRGEVGTFVYVGDSAQTAEDVLSADGRGDGNALEGAQMWLEDYLTQQGATRAKSVFTEGKQFDHHERTLYRAAKRLKVHKSYRGFPRESYWELPAEEGEIDYSEPGGGRD